MGSQAQGNDGERLHKYQSVHYFRSRIGGRKRRCSAYSGSAIGNNETVGIIWWDLTVSFGASEFFRLAQCGLGERKGSSQSSCKSSSDDRRAKRGTSQNESRNST